MKKLLVIICTLNAVGLLSGCSTTVNPPPSPAVTTHAVPVVPVYVTPSSTTTTYN